MKDVVLALGEAGVRQPPEHLLEGEHLFVSPANARP
jgi:hypothetical protein